MELRSKFQHFVSYSKILFDSPFTLPVIGSDAGDSGEGLLLRGALVTTVNSLVNVGVPIRRG